MEAKASGDLLPRLAGTVSVWPGFSFSLVQTKLPLGVGTCASRPHMSIYSLGGMILSHNTQPNRVILF